MKIGYPAEFRHIGVRKRACAVQRLRNVYDQRHAPSSLTMFLETHWSEGWEGGSLEMRADPEKEDQQAVCHMDLSQGNRYWFG
jgi:hypothetical protein